MSFSAEMKDFFAAFQTTSGVVDNYKDRKMAKEKLDILREANPTLDDLGAGYDGAQPIDFDTSTDDGSDSEDTSDDDVAVPPVIDPAEEREKGKRKVYGPGGTSAYYAGGGSVKTDTQKGRLPVDMSKMNKDLLNRWKKVQQEFGRDLSVVSAYRDPARNRKAGGAKKSQHMHGNAIDIDVSGLSRPERLELIKIASANGMTGIGVYNNSLHFDVGNRRAWGPSYKSASIPGWARGTIQQHMAGKFGDYSPEATYAGNDAPAPEQEAAIPVEDSTAPDYGDLLSGGMRAAAIPMGREEQDNSALEAFYKNDGIDISAIDVPQPGLYKAGDMTQTPQPTAYAAGGGTVPWAGQTSYVNRRRGPMGSYFQRRPYTPRYTPPSNSNSRDNSGGNGWTEAEFLEKYGAMFGRNNQSRNSSAIRGVNILNPASLLGMNWKPRYEDGGTVPDEKGDLETALPIAEPQRPRAPAAIEMDSPEQTPAREGKGNLGQIIDLGLKHLTKALGLDEAGAAVGPDPDLRRRRKLLTDGAVGVNEPPPSPEEMKQVFQTVDPNGELNESLRSIYALRKGVEFYMKRGDQAKAAKWAASLIQFSNLVSRQYGIEAVQAGKSGDVEKMVQLAVKSYSAIPDGMDAQAELVGGKVKVTRTDEDGNVVDVHSLSPQQVFQMATGISAGSGYFDALIQVAGGKKGKSGPDPETVKARAQAFADRFASVAEYATEGDKKAFNQFLAVGDWQSANDIIRDASARAPKAETLTPAQQAAQKSKVALAGVYAGLLPDIEAEMTEPEKQAWQAAVDAAQAPALKDLYDNVKARLSKKEQKALAAKKIGGLKELRDDYAADLTPAQQKALDAAFAENDVATVDRIYDAVDKVREQRRQKAEGDEKFTKTQEAIDKRQTAGVTESDRVRKEKEDKALEQRKKDVEVLDALYESYSPYMTLGQKRAWDIAKRNVTPDKMEDIIRNIDSSGNGPTAEDEAALNEQAIEQTDDRNWLSKARDVLLTPWSSDEQAIPETPAPAQTAPTSAGNAGRPLPPALLEKAKQAIAQGRSRAGVIQKLKEQGYDPAGL